MERYQDYRPHLAREKTSDTSSDYKSLFIKTGLIVVISSSAILGIAACFTTDKDYTPLPSKLLKYDLNHDQVLDVREASLLEKDILSIKQ